MNGQAVRGYVDSQTRNLLLYIKTVIILCSFTGKTICLFPVKWENNDSFSGHDGNSIWVFPAIVEKRCEFFHMTGNSMCLLPAIVE